MRTTKSLHSTMDFDMFVQISSLGKAISAPWNWALVWSFVRVNPEVIEEIMPLPKVFSAIFMIALQYLNIPLGLGILESEDPELVSAWHVLFNLNRFQVKGLSCLN